MPGYVELREQLLSIVDGVYDDENEIVRRKTRWSEEEAEQAACCAVCARTSMTPQVWDRLRLWQERVPWLEEAIRIALREREAGFSRNKEPSEDYPGGTGTPPEQPVQPDRLSPECFFAPDGDGYYLAGFGESGHLTDKKGFAAIAQLIASPDVPVSMLDLVGANQPLRNDRHSCQPVMDQEGLQQAQHELRELYADLDKARSENNTFEAEQAQQEIDGILANLKTAIGLRGKIRDLNCIYNTLRARIYGQLNTVYEAMRAAKPSMKKLANHFDNSIKAKDGEFVYRPAGIRPVWKFQK